jgi:hypothetical protein
MMSSLIFPALQPQILRVPRHSVQMHAMTIMIQQPAPALPLHLPGDQRAGARPPRSVLHRLQQSSHYPIPLQGRSAYWTRLRRHAAGPGQQQQALRGEHLDMALRPGQPPDGVLSTRRRGSEPSGSARAGPGRQRRGSVTARPLQQRGRRKAAAERIEHWPMIS